MPQTIFGIDGVAERLIVPILNDAKFVMTRDAETFRYLSEFGLSTHLIDAVDTALLCGRPTVGTGATTEPGEIAVVPRFSTLGDTGTLDQDGLEMEDTFVEYVARLVDAGFEVTLATQTEMDRRWADRNREQLADIGVSRWCSSDPDELRTFYAGQDLLVTMRLHAGIFALSMGTPAIGVYRPEWGPKISGTWETLDIEHLALSWDEATTDRLLSATEEALTNRTELSTNLVERVSSVTEQLVDDFEAELNWG
jgi:polysaccharide pyruvyl transferase WcaK-like protein